MLNYEALGRRIRRKRQERGLTQKQMSERVNLSCSYYGHIERGTRVPSLDTLILIANELYVGTDALLRDSLQAPVRVERNPLFNNQDLHLLRAYLSAQQDALDHWLDEDDPQCDTEDTDEQLA